MDGRNRILSVLEGKIPDKVPHFELDFQLTEETFGLAWPNEESFGANSAGFAREYFGVWTKIIDEFHWDAIHIRHFMMGNDGKAITLAREHFGDKVAVYDYNGQGTFWMLPGDGMMEFTIRLFEDRESLHEEARQKCRDSIQLARQQIESGVDFICINSDYGYNNGPFISPAMFEELVTPYLTEIVYAIHEMGKKAILHSDGDLRLILDQLVSTGIDGYQSVDPQGHMDIAEVRRSYPNLILMGNVQTSLLQEVNDEKIRESVRYAMHNAMPGGKYIFSSSNCIFSGLPLESYRIMLDEYQKHANY